MFWHSTERGGTELSPSLGEFVSGTDQERGSSRAVLVHGGGGAGGAQCVPAHLQRGSGRVGGPPSSIVSLAAIAASAAAALSLGKPRAAQLQRSWERNVLLLWLLARIGTRPGAKRKGELLS